MPTNTWPFLAALALATLAQAQTAVKPIADAHCQISVPSDWTASNRAGIGARSPGDRRFDAVVRSFDSAEYQTAVDSMKQANATVVDQNANHILLVAPALGGRKQYVEITKSHPLGCRVNINFPADQEPIARKIADSVKPLK